MTDILSTALEQMVDRLSTRDDLAGWRLNVVESTRVTAGILSNRLGGPYAPPSQKTTVGGDLTLIWQDDRRTITSVSRQLFEEPLPWSEWQAIAYIDPDAPEIPEPTIPPNVQLWDPELAKQVEQTDMNLLLPLTEVHQVAHSAKFIDAAVAASTSHSWLFSSRGHALQSQFTSYNHWLMMDQLCGDQFSSRIVSTYPERLALLNSIALRYAQLQQSAQGWLTAGEGDVILDPDVVEALIGHFLLQNLSGLQVANRQSRLHPDDFGHRQLIREDLSLWLDTTRPLHTGSYAYTDEGIPSGRLALVENGIAITPYLDVKYAKKLGRVATPTPQGTDSLELIAPTQSWDELLRGPSPALLVLSVLGMHTQDAAAGRFSLTAQPCLEVSTDGRFGGQIKAVIAGDFFTLFSDPTTRFAQVPGKDFPAVRLRCSLLPQE